MSLTQANPVGIISKDIYVIKNDVNDKLYVGQSKDVKERFRSHCKKNNTVSLLDDAIQEYGKEHFWYEILEEQVSDADNREKYWIKRLGTLTPNGYNIMEGGSAPPCYSGEDNHNTVISDADVDKLMWDLANTDESLSCLGHKYGISKRQVMRINDGSCRKKPNVDYPIRKVPNACGKLTEEDVDKIIHLLKYTYRFYGDIGREFGVGSHSIQFINDGITHRRDDINYPIRDWKSSGVILFTYEQVTEIIDRLKNTDISINKLAKEYGVNSNSIYKINRGTAKKYRREGIKYPIRPY